MMHQIAPKEQQIKCFTLKKKIERRKKIGEKKEATCNLYFRNSLF